MVGFAGGQAMAVGVRKPFCRDGEGCAAEHDVMRLL